MPLLERLIDFQPSLNTSNTKLLVLAKIGKGGKESKDSKEGKSNKDSKNSRGKGTPTSTIYILLARRSKYRNLFRLDLQI